jgi:hypothetical protein
MKSWSLGGDKRLNVFGVMKPPECVTSLTGEVAFLSMQKRSTAATGITGTTLAMKVLDLTPG